MDFERRKIDKWKERERCEKECVGGIEEVRERERER
jgi:hypothetical protein